jgi:hypothetical protein
LEHSLQIQKNLLDKPDDISAEITAEGPGIEVTFIFSSMALATSSYPGSDIKGVPASEIMAKEAPSFINFRNN